jgi:hypothetical protein
VAIDVDTNNVQEDTDDEEEDEEVEADVTDNITGKLYVDMDFLASGQYEWGLPYQNDLKSTKVQKKKLPDDFIKSQKTISRDHARDHCIHFGLEVNDDNIDNIVCQMTTTKCAIEQTIRTIIYRYWIFVAKNLGLKKRIQGKSYPLRTVDDLLTSIRQVSSREDAIKVLCVLYISFDWLPKYQKKIAEVVCEINAIKVVDSANRTKASSNFVEKQVSLSVNNERKNLNTMSMNSNGYTYTIMKHGVHLENSVGNREKKYVYDWMIIGELVSQIFVKIILMISYLYVILFFFEEKIRRKSKKKKISTKLNLYASYRKQNRMGKQFGGKK